MLKFIMPLTLLLSLSSFGSTSPLDIKVNLLKDRFLAGEPIPIAMTVSNVSAHELYVRINPPTLQEMDYAGLSLIVDGEKKAAWHNPGEPISGYSTFKPRIGPNKSVHFCVFLNRFVTDLKPGTHRVNYSFSLFPDENGSEEDSKPIGTSAGQLTFSIDGVLTADKMNAVFKMYAENIDASITDSNAWMRNEALEAIVTCIRPEIIPYLKNLVERQEDEYALPALRKFKGYAQAQSIAITALDSNNRGTTILALDIITDWKSRLPKDRVNKLLQSEIAQVRMATLGYIEALGDVDYIELVRNVTSDKDPKISAKAKIVLQKLTAQKTK